MNNNQNGSGDGGSGGTDLANMAREGQILAAMPRDMALLRMENDQIFAIAKASPRNYLAMRKQLEGILEAFPESAEEAIYNKPVGTVIEINCENCKRAYTVPFIPRTPEGAPCPECEKWSTSWRWKKKRAFARNLSIRAAETIRVAFGFNRVATTISKEEDNLYRVGATFCDYVTGNVTQDDKLVSQFRTTWQKTTEKINDDRFFGVVLEAEKSKIRRNTILNGVPGELKAAFRAKAEEIIGTLLKDSVVDKLIAAFAAKGVTETQLAEHIGRPRNMGWTIDDKKDLAGIWRAIEDGEITVREAFEKEEVQTQPTGSATTVSGVDLTGQVKTEPRTVSMPGAAPAPPPAAAAAAAAPAPKKEAAAPAKPPAAAAAVPAAAPPAEDIPVATTVPVAAAQPPAAAPAPEQPQETPGQRLIRELGEQIDLAKNADEISKVAAKLTKAKKEINDAAAHKSLIERYNAKMKSIADATASKK